jgi:predicted helicase
MEADEAGKIKLDTPVMVVLGNPPYSGESMNASQWIVNLISQYKKEPNHPTKNIPDTKWLNNDYVKFIRFGQHFIEKNGEGVLAYITGNSFLDGLTFRGMRHNLMQTFNKIYIINLHGSSIKKETAIDGSKDENVFDIQQGVSINIFVKTKHSNDLADVYYHDLYGKRYEKFNSLLKSTIKNVKWKKLKPIETNFFFIPKDFSKKTRYEKGFKVNNLFSVNGIGICSKRDSFTIHYTKESLIKTIKEFISLGDDEARKKFNLGKDTDWNLF